MRVPLGISARPFDFFVAFLVFFMGLYGILDPDWPPEGPVGSGYYILLVEDAYLMTAGAIIMSSLIIKQCSLAKRFRHRHKDRVIISSIVGEMFGWLFVSAAAAVIAITSWVLPPTALHFEHLTNQMLWGWFFLWSGLAIASGQRFRDLRNVYKHNKGPS